MSKGIFEFTETFLKILTAAYLAVMLLGMFFAINNYYLYFRESEVNRNVLSLADGLLFSECLVEYRNGLPVKALLNETKLGNAASCNFKFGNNFKYEVLLARNDPPLFTFGGPLDEAKSRSSLYPAAMIRTTGEIVAVTMNVTVESS